VSGGAHGGIKEGFVNSLGKGMLGCPGWIPKQVCLLLWPGIGGSREGGWGRGNLPQNFGVQVSGLMEGARGGAFSHDQSGSAWSCVVKGP
jgi:hypothetical protein